MAKDKKKQSEVASAKKTDRQYEITLSGLAMVCFSIIGLLQLGILGKFLTFVFVFIFGSFYAIVLLLACLYGSYVFIVRRWFRMKMDITKVGLMLFIFGLFVFSSQKSGMKLTTAPKTYLGLFTANTEGLAFKIDVQSLEMTGGGFIGHMLYGLFSSVLSEFGTTIIIWIVILAGGSIITLPLFDKIFDKGNGHRFTRAIFRYPLNFYRVLVTSSKPKNLDRQVTTERRAKIEDSKAGSTLSKTMQIPVDTKISKIKLAEGQIIPEVKLDNDSENTISKAVDFDEVKDSKKVNYKFVASETEKDDLDLLLLRPDPNFLKNRNESLIPDFLTDNRSSKKLMFDDPLDLQAKIEETYIPTAHDDYSLPSLSLLFDNKDIHLLEASKNDARLKAAILSSKFVEYNIRASIISWKVGPTITRYEIIPEAGVKVSTIANLQPDLMLALATKTLRIEAPIPGKSVIGIEVANETKLQVTLKEALETLPPSNERLLAVIGKNLDGTSVAVCLNKMPHLLVAGATGSGKSVVINSIIISLLMRTSPSEVKLLLIDPKKVELSIYRDLPHLLMPVVTEPDAVVTALEKVMVEMNRRFTIFSEIGVKNLEAYNQKNVRHKELQLPYIIIVIDELADLMISKWQGQIETKIQRITQLARAAGIHLIIATQRPSVDIITGVIKSNIPSRFALAVSSHVDSKTIIDVGGAENLLGQGDMLISLFGQTNLERVQGAYVSDQEIENVVNFWKSQSGPLYDSKFLET